ncbi:MAG: chemotaxis protein CheX [Candidatus Eisenbacteria sp.]|nr:chemotaxis protein CheX [Candidatus Eisenbacteria bacterium]
MATDATTVEKIKKEFLKPFVQGVMTTLETMASMTPSIKGIELVASDRFSGDVSAIMGLAGQGGEGFVGITFNANLAKTVVSKVLHLEEEELDDNDINDGVGELINMIAGSAKNALLGTPYCFQLALPNVITGRGHEVAYPRNADCWTSTLEVAGTEFHLHVAYAKK